MAAMELFFQVKVAKSVDVLKTNLSKQKLADSTKRSKITNFIVNKNSRRQEFCASLR